jgi:flagellar biogenesis protein FliO
MMEEFLRVGFSLIAVVFLIVIAARLIQSRAQQPGMGLLRTLGYLSLGPRRGIAIIKAGKEILLIGVTPTDIKLLKSMQEDHFDMDLKTMKDNIEHIKTLKDLFRKNWISRNKIEEHE